MTPVSLLYRRHLSRWKHLRSLVRVSVLCLMQRGCGGARSHRRHGAVLGRTSAVALDQMRWDAILSFVGHYFAVQG